MKVTLKDVSACPTCGREGKSVVPTHDNDGLRSPTCESCFKTIVPWPPVSDFFCTECVEKYRAGLTVRQELAARFVEAAYRSPSDLGPARRVAEQALVAADVILVEEGP